MRIRDAIIQLIGARDPNCPNDADVLAYSEGRLSPGSRANFERHFSRCDDCRLVLASLGREACEAPAQVAEDAVTAQTNSVLAYIQNDERTRNRSVEKVRPAAGFYVSYPKLASVGLAMVAIVIAAVFGPRLSAADAADAAMEALRLGVKDSRYTEARVSGGFSHSRYAGTTRGGESNNVAVHFERAEDKLKAAGEESRSDKEKLVLARIYLERATREHSKLALEILNQLSARGVETAESLNDTGVAQFQLDNYTDAIVYFTKALAKTPGYDEALFNRALAEGRARRDAEARQDWTQFLSQASDENWKNEARNYLSKLASPAER